MRGDRSERTARDMRHNKDHDKLKSSLKKGGKPKKNRVVFDESANEFFEADYIIVVRDECGYSDTESEECSGCGGCDRYQEPESGALSPPEGYKDLGLFNRDGTLREQAWWEAGDVVLVGERSGTVFTPQHLQLLRRLQRERLLRSTVCAECDAHADHHPQRDGYEDVENSYEEETSDVERDRDELRPAVRRTGKHIAAGEERPRINSSQQTTPTDDSPSEAYIDDKRPDLLAPPATSEESDDTTDAEGRLSAESSPLRRRKGGILKGGRLWKYTDGDNIEQNDDQRSTTASDEDGSVTPRSVRFLDRPKDSDGNAKHVDNSYSDSELIIHKENYTVTRNEAPDILSTQQQPKSSSAVQQLFNSDRPPPPIIEPQLVTSETLRAWHAGVRPKTEEAAVRRIAERNALRCSLLRSEARKRQPPKQNPIPLAERIRLLTCDMDDQDDVEPRPPAGACADKLPGSCDKLSSCDSSSLDKSYSSEKSEKAFGSASSSSSSSTVSAPVSMSSRQPPELGDTQQDTQKSRRLLSTLAPLTACVGHADQHEGFYYLSPSERNTTSSASNFEDHNDRPAPDVVAGTPGSGDGTEGLAAFSSTDSPRSQTSRQRRGQESPPVSSDGEHDDYGFHRRPIVRGISAKHLGASEDILRQMQSELQPSSAGQPPAHACQRGNPNYAYVPYYQEGSRPQSRASTNSNWSKTEYVKAQPYFTGAHLDLCYAQYTHEQNAGVHEHYQNRQPEPLYRNCSLYANVGCSDSSQELYSSSSEQTSPVRPRGRRPESPPPIRPHHHLLYVPYAHHYRYQQADHAHYWTAADYSHKQQYQQQRPSTHAAPHAAPQHAPHAAAQPAPPPAASQAQRAPTPQPQYAHAIHMQNMCPAPVCYRTVPSSQPGDGKQMICFSEKVAAPVYQPAPGSPSRAGRGPAVPAGAPNPSATSPLAPPPNPVYYAMNV